MHVYDCGSEGETSERCGVLAKADFVFVGRKAGESNDLKSLVAVGQFQIGWFAPKLSDRSTIPVPGFAIV